MKIELALKMIKKEADASSLHLVMI